MMPASAALSLPCRTKSPRDSSIFSFVTTAAPMPARTDFLIRSIIEEDNMAALAGIRKRKGAGRQDRLNG